MVRSSLPECVHIVCLCEDFVPPMHGYPFLDGVCDHGSSLPRVCVDSVCVRILSHLDNTFSACVYDHGSSLPECVQIVCVCIRILSHLGYPFSVGLCDHGSPYQSVCR